ncbi:two component, sigma54 specific, transcriptional regulator, Fis family [Candidatus Vecturithrix granuli]|uniref:Two component, sigma54 specific, transcriptional regulator, Fis family n=1 Tax=Vecturithrix granuli TaxID=1499967 RepID=A0A081C7U1_VECG1|nr:two component, sigma54 specific, transcriptional regulator, Fis family [Candidatus Vecturithrix granuli]
MEKCLLIIDDNSQLCQTLAQNFARCGYRACYAINQSEALEIVARQALQVILLDMMLGEDNGLDLAQQIQRICPHIPIIMITGYASIESAVQAIKLGAFDYVSKPLKFDHLVAVVENALKSVHAHEVRPEAADAPGMDSFRTLTHNAQMLELDETITKLAATDLPVLICGEHGVGKEIVADVLHSRSTRQHARMLKVNCAAFPETLLDNELFGHEKGAYTGATTAFKGVFERANHSTLFLDEIGDMPLTIQAKILRTLQNHEIRRLGGQATIQVDVRFLAATNQDLKKLIREGQFREDLFYRLNAATLYVPPLRERKDDLPVLLNHFLDEHAHLTTTQRKCVSEDVFQVFLQYQWPGNIRELKNVIHYAAAVSTFDTIDLRDLPSDLRNLSPQGHTMNIREEMEKNLILTTLRNTDYNKKKTAELLNMGRKTLYDKLKKYGITL